MNLNGPGILWVRIMGLLMLFSGSLTVSAQNFSFNCSRDTIVPACPPTLCITLLSKIPDIHGLTNSYTLNPSTPYPGACTPVYVAPDDPAGTSAQLTIDDRYSSVINIGFPFSYYGSIYNSLVASTNGYLSFDVSLANQGAEWSITSNLPSFDYDPAVIMGPMHDLDPSIGTSPDRRIQYQVWGIAPHRRWILSFYKVPLYLAACNPLIENTHQIVLYESTGIIEVTILSKQPCTSWNSGRGMVGIQDFTRTQAMMAPNRAGLDPPWGTVGMNESWRFVPNGGPSLFKRVELLDIGGSMIATGTASPAGNGLLQASFPNICAPAGATTSYIVRSVYQKIDDPSVEIFGLDTVRVNRAAGLAASASTTPASCGTNNGSITVSPPTGGTAPYEFSLDGVTWQSSNTFTNLAAGNYIVHVRDNGAICTIDIPVTVANAGALAATTSSTATACSGINNGSITVTSAAGTGPWSFVLDGGAPVTGTVPYTFSNLSAGTHTIVVIDQNTGCASNTLSVTIATGTGVSANASATATTCPAVSNGTITVNATAGSAPFTFQLDSGTPQPGTNPYTFTNVPAGPHTVTVIDNVGCTRTINVNVAAGAALTANASANPTSCNGAANGSITVTPTSGIGPYTYSLDGAAPVAGPSPYTFTNVPGGNHNIIVADASGCVTNTIIVNVPVGPNLVTTSGKTDVLCNGGSTGSITVTPPSTGTPPFEYSLDGINWQISPIFSGLAAGTYTVYYRESNGCQGSHSVTIAEPALLGGSAGSVAVVCNGQNNGTITVTASGGVIPYLYSIDGGANWQAGNSFSVAAGSYTITIQDANGCIITRPVTVTEPLVLSASAIAGPASCDGGNNGTITITANGGNPSYQYSLDGSIFQASNIFNVAPGNYTVTVKDNLGCLTTLTTLVPLGSNFTMTAQSDKTICEGTSTQLQLISNATVYSWSPTTGLSDPTIANPVANPTVTTQYIVTATLGRCSSEDTVIVNVNAAPIPNAGPDGFICYGQTYQLQGSGGVQYTWSPATFLDDPTIADPVSSPTANVTYTLTEIIDALGCRSLTTDEMTVDVTPPIKVKTFPYDSIGYPGAQFQLLATTNDSDVINYSWTPAWGLSNSNIADPIVSVGAIGDDVTYQVTASTIAGCKGEGYVRVRVYKGPDIYVVTGFTPNGDGKNDRFIPFPVGVKQLKYFRVFNRWGQLIYSTSNLHEGWDGKLSGRDQPTGVYVWMAEAITDDNRVITKKGTVTLIR